MGDDGCSEDCEMEIGSLCYGEPSSCVASRLQVILRWNQVDLDVDLSLARESAEGFCWSGLSGTVMSNYATAQCADGTTETCFYSNCLYDRTPRPDWDGDGTFSPGDPLVRNDEIRGCTPEILEVGDIADGRYLVMANPRGVVPEDSVGELTIVVDGEASLSQTAAFPLNGFYDLALVLVAGGAICVDDLQTPENECQ